MNDSRFKFVEMYSIDNGRFVVDTLECAELTRSFFCKGSLIHKVLGVKTSTVTAVTNPIIVLEEV